MSLALYRLIATLACLAVRSGRSKELEIIVLRHQLAVLRRQNDRPALNDNDRTLLGAIAAALPRPRRDGWLVTPDTLLRWHRQRIARSNGSSSTTSGTTTSTGPTARSTNDRHYPPTLSTTLASTFEF